MKRITGSLKNSASGRLTLEYISVGVVVSLLSAFLGFYSAAFIIADKCYPELGLETIQTVHRQLFHNMALAAAIYALVLFSLYWFLARSQIKNLLRTAGQRGCQG